MKTIEALENALLCLEMKGYKGGDIHDDLAQAIQRVKRLEDVVLRADALLAESKAKGQAVDAARNLLQAAKRLVNLSDEYEHE